MIIMSLNCRGLGNCRAVQVLADLVRLKGPIILFLMEMKLSIQEMEPIKNEIGFQSMLAVSSVHRSEGFALLWKETITVDPQTFSLHHIDVHVTVSPQEPWRLTRLYGHSEEQHKKETWTMLKNLHTRAALPWACIRDFNEVLQSSKKSGRLPKPLRVMQEFQNSLVQCDLVDIGYQGYPYTWRNGRFGNAFVELHLDRALVNLKWKERFPMAKVRHKTASYSDHDPITLHTGTKSNLRDRRRKL